MSLEYPPIQSSHSREEGFWTFAAVEERLVEALRLWERSPGGGKWPFAADAPWHLMTRRTRLSAADYKPGREMQLHLQREDEDETRRMEGRERKGPLTRDEIARRDEATEWLGLVPDGDRKLVILALTRLARGDAQVPWMRLKRLLGVEFGAHGLRKRYSRALTRIANSLNGPVAAR